MVVKISDKLPKRVSHGLNGNIWSSKYDGGYFDKGLRRPFSSPRKKAEFMRRNNLVMESSNESESHRTQRLCDIVNSDRESKGLRPKTNEELKGVQ